MRIPKTGPWLLVGVLVVAGGLALFQLPWGPWLQSFKTWVDDLGTWGYVALGAAYVIAAVLLIPTWPLSITGGFAFGVWGFVCVPLMATLAACAAFLIGRYFARSMVQKWLAGRPRFRADDQAIEEEGWKVVLLLRLSPLVPYNLMNYFSGVTRISFPAYAVATLVGTTPVTSLYVYLGFIGQAAATGGAVTWLQWALFGVGLIATLGVTVLITRKVRAKLREPGSARAGAHAWGHQQQRCRNAPHIVPSSCALPRMQDATFWKTKAALTIVDEANRPLSLGLVKELAEPLAEYMLADYLEAKDWQDSQLVEPLARVAALLEADGREVPPSIMAALRKSAEAGRPVGVA
jgi:uncharacterized membrane protein YdjX (TVP38/TMEM64 family)